MPPVRTLARAWAAALALRILAAPSPPAASTGPDATAPPPASPRPRVVPASPGAGAVPARPSSAGRGAGEASTVVVGLRAEPATLNPLYVTSAAGRDIVELVYGTLLEEREDARHFGPRLAERWEVRDGGRTIVFHLRRDARWEDGHPVTADDVRFTWRLHTDTTVAWPHASTKSRIADVDVIDRWTVAFRFSRYDPWALADANEGVILPRHVLADVPRSALRTHAIGRRPVGSGPLALSRWEAGRFIELRARDDVSDGAPAIRRIVLRIVPDLPTLLARIEHGDIDAFDGVPPDAARRLARRADLRIVQWPSRRFAFVAWNCARPPLDDARVRRALGMAVDRASLIEALWGEYARPVDAAVHPTLWAHDATIPALGFSRREARAQLERAGWRDRDGDGELEDADGRALAVEIVCSDNPTSIDGATIVQHDLAAIGVRASVQVLEFGAFTQRVLDGHYDAAWVNWRAGTRTDLTPMWHSASVPPHGYNFMRIRDARLDALIEAARESADADSARALWRRAQRRIHALQPVFLVAVPSELGVLRRRICDVTPGPAGLLATIRRWRLAPDCAASPAGGFERRR